MSAPSNPYHTCETCGKNVKDLRGHWRRMHNPIVVKPVPAPKPVPVAEPKPVPVPVAEPVPEPKPVPVPVPETPKTVSPPPPSYDEEFDEYLESILTTGSPPEPEGGWQPVPPPTKGWQGKSEPVGGAGAPSFAMVATAAASKPAPPPPETSFHYASTNDPNVEKLVNALMRNARPLRTCPTPPSFILLQHVWGTAKKMANGIHGDPSDPYFSVKVCLQRDGGDKYGIIPTFVTLHLHVRQRPLDSYYVATRLSIRTSIAGMVHDDIVIFERPHAYNGA